MTDETPPGDEHPEPVGESSVPESSVPGETSPWAGPVADPAAGSFDATDPGLPLAGNEATPDPTTEIPAAAAGWGAQSGPVPPSPDADDASWAASQHAAPAPVPVATTATPEKERNRKPRSVLVGAIAGAVVGALVASGVFLAVHDDSRPGTVTTVVEKTAKPASSVIKQASDIHAVIAKVRPATVAITTGSAVNDTTPSANDSQFNSQQSGAAGTGFIISSDGYVVTNNHVIADAGGKIEVTFDSGSSKRAKLVGTDARSDIAVLKVDGVSSLPTVDLGDSSQLTVGDDVIAIGNALALEGGPTVTRGIVSGLNRTIDTEGGTLVGAVQTDASINHGNSGGPLVNSRGQVIGIVDAIADPSTNQNVDFAIAIDQAKPVISALKAGQKVKTAYMGVTGQTVDSSLAASLKLRVTTGVVVHSLVSGGPADQAALKKNDVIQSVGDTTVTSSQDLVAAVRGHQPGDKVDVQINRDGKSQTVSVTLGEMPSGSR